MLNAAQDPELKGSSFSYSSDPITVGTGQITLDEMPAYYYRGARYTITVVDEQNNVETSEWILMHDTASVSLTNLNTVNNLVQGYVATFSGRLVRGHLQLLFQGNGTRHVVRFYRQPVKADASSPISIYDQLAEGIYSQEGNGETGPGRSPMMRLIDDADPALGGSLNVANHSIYGVNVTIDPSNQLIITGDTVPSDDGVKDLGSTTKRWDSLYANKLYVGSTNIRYDIATNRLQVSDNSSTYSIAKNLQDLADVSTTAPAANQSIIWSTVTSKWTPANVALNAITNVQVVGGDLIYGTSSSDTLNIEGGYGISVVADPLSKKLTFSTIVIDTNTTYSANLTAATGGVNFNLVGSDAVNDAIKFTSGSGISVSRSSAKELIISAVQVADLQSVASRGTSSTFSIQINNGTSSSSTSSGALTVLGGLGVGENINLGGSLNVGGNIVVSGNLTVNGTPTIVNSTTLSVADKNIELGTTGTPTNATADGGGITLKGLTDKSITWTASNAAWNISEHINLVSGKSFFISNQSVLNSTTLGSGVVNSSLTTLGTLTSLTSSGVVRVNNGTPSTAIDNGALVVSGGVGVGGALYVGGVLTVGSGFAISGPIDLSNNVVTLAPVSEKVFSIANAINVITHDWSQHPIFYHTSVQGSFTADIINVPTTTSRTLSVILVIEQSATPYICNGIKVNSINQTIKWQTGAAPLGTSNGVDVITFSLIRIGSSWTVLGQLVSFG